MTGSQLVTAALEMIGAWSTADGELPGADAERALTQANLLRKSWNAHDLALHAIERASFTWTSAQSSRTIGPSGANLTGTRPLQILHAKVIPAGETYEVDLGEPMTEAEYAAIGDKTQTADYFTRLRYEPTGATMGTITVWPVPTTAPTLVLHNKVPLAAIELDAEMTVPEAYEAVLVSSLAKRCAAVFGKPWTRELEETRREDWAIVQRANIRIPEVQPVTGFPGQRSAMTKTAFTAGTV